MRLFLVLIFLFSSPVYAKPLKVKYKTRFENCPSQVLGRLTLKLIKYFEKSKSLYSVKKKIIDEKLAEIYYLEDYKISYNPLKKMLNLYFKCPIPSFEIEFLHKNSEHGKSGVLAENGVILSSGYLSLLRAEGKFTSDLPSMTLMTESSARDIARVTKIGNRFKSHFSNELAELILDESSKLTAILSVQNNPVSVFLGKENWPDKIVKLKKTITYLDKKTRIPNVINLTDVKKVVVKFPDNK